MPISTELSSKASDEQECRGTVLEQSVNTDSFQQWENNFGIIHNRKIVNIRQVVWTQAVPEIQWKKKENKQADSGAQHQAEEVSSVYQFY